MRRLCKKDCSDFSFSFSEDVQETKAVLTHSSSLKFEEVVYYIFFTKSSESGLCCFFRKLKSPHKGASKVFAVSFKWGRKSCKYCHGESRGCIIYSRSPSDLSHYTCLSLSWSSGLNLLCLCTSFLFSHKSWRKTISSSHQRPEPVSNFMSLKCQMCAEFEHTARPDDIRVPVQKMSGSVLKKAWKSGPLVVRFFALFFRSLIASEIKVLS